MGSAAWGISALITGIWTVIHFIFLMDSVGTTSTVYQEMVVANTAIVFTLSLIATLFFIGKALEALEAGEKEKGEEMQRLKELKEEEET